MAKDSSFDVVSEVNMQEVDNAFQQTTREISQRYDLKDSGATIELSKGDKLFLLCLRHSFRCDLCSVDCKFRAHWIPVLFH